MSKADEVLDSLTLKQRKFVEAYLGAANGNGTQAARLAGYKGNDDTLAVVSVENLRKPNIAQAIGARTAKILKVLSADEILQGVSTIASASEIEKTRDRLKAYELLGKYRRVWGEDAQPPDNSRTFIVNVLAHLPPEAVGQLAKAMLAATSANGTNGHGA